ncbi:MAG: FMN-binding protein [Bacillota bacterium]
MKKAFVFLLIAGLILAMAVGCSKPAATEQPAPQPTTESKYQDGTYKATYDFIDGHGWKPQVEIVVEGGKITKAVMDYVNPDGKLKSEDAAYAKNMKAKSGIAPAEAYEKMNAALVETQDIGAVDTVAGATSSSEFFKALSKAALANAEKGDTAAVILPMNDTYTAAETEADERGWKSEIAITYENGKITKVVYNEVNQNDGQKKRESAEYNDSFKAKSGITAEEAQSTLEKALVEKQDVDAVDVVTGATSTSEKFKTLAKEAMANRK